VGSAIALLYDGVESPLPARSSPCVAGLPDGFAATGVLVVGSTYPIASCSLRIIPVRDS